MASRLDAELIDVIAGDVAAGVSLKNAGSHQNLPEATVKGWKTRGEKFEGWKDDPEAAPESERLYVKLAHEIYNARRKAMRILEKKCHEDVLRGRVPTGLGILERLDRDTWGKKEQVDHSHGLQIQVNLPPWAQPKQLTTPIQSALEEPKFDYDNDAEDGD